MENVQAESFVMLWKELQKDQEGEKEKYKNKNKNQKKPHCNHTLSAAA